MYQMFGFLILLLLLNSCDNQTAKNETIIVGGPCEDCEAALDYKLLNLMPKSVDSLPGYTETNPKLKISGTVFKRDGKNACR